MKLAATDFSAAAFLRIIKRPETLRAFGQAFFLVVLISFTLGSLP
jgi:hypothetical protein